jgi:hypothetical protein
MGIGRVGGAHGSGQQSYGRQYGGGGGGQKHDDRGSDGETVGSDDRGRAARPVRRARQVNPPGSGRR